MENKCVVPWVQLGAEATRHTSLLAWNLIIIRAHVREHDFAYPVLEPDCPFAWLR